MKQAHESAEGEERLPVVRVGDLSEDESARPWLIEGLWGRRAVGILCGQPKSYKSWTGLDLAVSVATQTDCLGRFPVHEPGPALVYLAEDSLAAVRERVAGIARHRGFSLWEIDLHVITAPSVRLDLSRDRARLFETVRELRPRLVVLDPLVRLHKLNENDCREISALLSYLRELQRTLDVALILVHHARKNGSGEAGQGLRGSGDFWAWSDTNLYLRRVRGRLQLAMEHRSAPAPEPVYLDLVASDPERIHLEVLDLRGEKAHEERSLRESVLEELAREAMTRAALRKKLSVRNERLGHALEHLESEGRIERSEKGWRLPQA